MEVTNFLIFIIAPNGDLRYKELSEAAFTALWRILKNGLFRRLGLPSTLIRHENRTFLKRCTQLFKLEENENTAFLFSCRWKTFRKWSFSN